MIPMVSSVATPGPTRRRTCRQNAGLPVVGLLSVVAMHAHSQGSPDAVAAKSSLSILPSVSVTQTFTNNANLSSTDQRGDLITQVTPAIRISSSSGRVQGTFDYSLTGLYYARGSQGNSFQQNLNAALSAVAVDNLAAVDLTGNISRQNISAVGTQSPDSSLQSSNQTEVRSFTVSPYLHGRLGSSVGWLVRLNYGTTHTDTDQIGNSVSTGGNAHVGSDGAYSRLNWALDVSRLSSDFSEGSKTVTDSGVASLIWNADPELQISARGGRQSNNVLTEDQQSSPTYGGGIRWIPSDRTTLSLQADKQYFGNSHNYSFTTRTSQTVWSVTDTRGVNADAATSAQGPAQTAYDLLNLQLTSKYPDPAQRQLQTLLVLQGLGISPTALVQGGFLSNAVTLQRIQSASFAYLGLRSTIVLTAQQTRSQPLDSAAVSVAGVSGTDAIRQRSLSAAVSYRLTPISTGSITLSDSRSLDTVVGTHANLKSVTGSWSTRLGLRTSLSLGARRSISNGDSGSDYTESAIFATIIFQL